MKMELKIFIQLQIIKEVVNLGNYNDYEKRNIFKGKKENFKG